MTEKLTVDADGKIVIPPEVIQKRGLHPGDELTLIESAEGLLVYHGGVDENISAWWNRLDEGQRLLAQDDALREEFERTRARRHLEPRSSVHRNRSRE